MVEILIVLAFVVVVEGIAIGIMGNELKKTDEVAQGTMTAVANMASSIAKGREEIDSDIDDVRNYINEVEDELLEKIESLQDKYDAADEMIKQVTRTAEEAQETEKKMQDGIDAILNYNSQKAINEIIR